MSQTTIYHNPRCSKSRQTLELLESQGIQPTIIKYLDTPPDRNALVHLLAMLHMKPRDLLRKGESEYKELGLSNKDLSDDQLIDAMVAHPRLIERPIVVNGDQATIGRPPENALNIL